MPSPTQAAPTIDDIRAVLIETYAVNDAMNQLILANLRPKAWRAQLPGATRRDGRTIAAIYAHMHNCRLAWLRYCTPHLKCPARLDPKLCTMKQAAAAHRKAPHNASACSPTRSPPTPIAKLKNSFADSGVPGPPGGTMFAYMFSHEAHHRGQVLMLAHQLGYRLPVENAAGIWNWDRLWKEHGLATRPR